MKLRAYIGAFSLCCLTAASAFCTQVSIRNRSLPPDTALISSRIDTLMYELSQQGIACDYDAVQKYIEIFEKYDWTTTISRCHRYFPYIEKIFADYDLPDVLKYLSVNESNSLNIKDQSSSGAMGIWQFMPLTASDYDMEVNALVDDRIDYLKETQAAAAYLKKLGAQFNDWLLAIASYNMGQGAVASVINNSGKKNPSFWDIRHLLREETANYVPRFLAIAYVFRYGMEPQFTYNSIDSLSAPGKTTVEYDMHFAQISDQLHIPIDTLRALNPQYKHDVIPGAYRHHDNSRKKDKNHYIALPSDKLRDFELDKKCIANYNRNRLLEHHIEVELTLLHEGKASKKIEPVALNIKADQHLDTIAHRFNVLPENIILQNNLKYPYITLRNYQNKILRDTLVYVYILKDTETENETVSSQETAQQISSPAAHISSVEEAIENGEIYIAPQNTEIVKETDSHQIKSIEHTVRMGQTIYSICCKYQEEYKGMYKPFTPDDVRIWNHLTSDKLLIGDKLLIYLIPENN